VSAFEKGFGSYRDFYFLTNWGLWLTFFTFLVSLYSTTPVPNKGCLVLKSYRNSPFHGWKWFTVLFELSLVLEVCITVIYWTLLHPNLFHSNDHIIKKFSLICDHTLPLMGLIIEYCVSNQPIVRHHFVVVMAVTIAYMVVNLYATLIWRAPYENINLLEVDGLIKIVICLVFLIGVYLALVFITKKKLMQ
jgi:hypothetical protein